MIFVTLITNEMEKKTLMISLKRVLCHKLYDRISIIPTFCKQYPQGLLSVNIYCSLPFKSKIGELKQFKNIK